MGAAMKNNSDEYETEVSENNPFVDKTKINLTDDQSQNTTRAKKQKESCCPNMTPFILMIALSVHSVFEGLAVGLAKDF